MPDDAELLRRDTAESSDAAFAELVARHVDLVYSAALRQAGGDTHRAQDVTQVVFTALARKAAQLKQHPVLAGWLYTAAQHAAASARRTEARRAAREKETHLMQLGAASEETQIDWARVRPVLDDAMRQLCDTDREAVLLRYFARQSFGAIGASLQLSEDAARMRVDRALDKLHTLLARRGVTSTASALGVVLGEHAVGAAPAGIAASIASEALVAATATGVVTATAALGGFMSHTTTSILGVVALAATGAASFQFNAARGARATIATLQRERDGLAAQVQSAPAHLAASMPSAPPATPPRSLPPSLVAATKAAVPAGAANAAQRDAETRAKDAAVAAAIASQEARLAQARSVENLYRVLFQQLRFSASDIERFKTLWTQRDASAEALLEELRTKGVRVDFTAREVVREQTEREFEAGLQREFGEAGARAYARFNETLAVRPLMNTLAAALLYTDTPLTGQQAEQLINIVAANARDAQGRVALETLNTAALDAQVQGVLAPGQLAAWREAATQAQAAARRGADAAPTMRRTGTSTGKSAAK